MDSEKFLSSFCIPDPSQMWEYQIGNIWCEGRIALASNATESSSGDQQYSMNESYKSPANAAAVRLLASLEATNSIGLVENARQSSNIEEGYKFESRLVIPVKKRSELVEVDAFLLDKTIWKDLILWIEQNWKPPNGKKAISCFMLRFFQHRMMVQIYCVNSKTQHCKGREGYKFESRLVIPVKKRSELVEVDAFLLDKTIRKDLILWIEQNWKPPNRKKAISCFMLRFFQHLMMAQIYCVNSKTQHCKGRERQKDIIKTVQERDSQPFTQEQDNPLILDHDMYPVNLQHCLNQPELRIPLNKLPGFYALIENFAALHLKDDNMPKLRTFINKVLRKLRNAERNTWKEALGLKERSIDGADSTQLTNNFAANYESAKSLKELKNVFIGNSKEQTELIRVVLENKN
ncbi:unnamed protein product [Notodromas monacha]|uniref:Uncharacterized protein n=1 Tax=Notodromas monacha TaxID=399045 RepID=A0A7R9BS47_9CRUS|nr:unnamed protein product [Notodromas monacha]CAG0920688.1 unnamed protein product [Notodromas monacha]